MGVIYELCCTKCNKIYDMDRIYSARRFISNIIHEHRNHSEHVAAFIGNLSDMDIERDGLIEVEFVEVLRVYDKGQDCMDIEDFIRTLDMYSPRRWQFKKTLEVANERV